MPASTNCLLISSSQPCHSVPSLQFTPLSSQQPHSPCRLQLELEINPGKREHPAMARPLSSFCLHRIRSGSAASTAAPPSICANREASDDDGGEICKSLKDDKQEGDREEAKKKGGVEAVVVGRKVMVAADGGSEEARTALQWALSHAVRPCDTVVLLDVVRGGGGNGKNRA